MYFGCEINSSWAIRRLASIDNFLFIYALDNFTKREKLLAKTKARITPADAKYVLLHAKDLGIKTTIAYIAGIDPLADMQEGFCEIREALTRFPIINIYQAQTAGQAKIFDAEATNLEYFVKSRIMIEKISKVEQHVFAFELRQTYRISVGIVLCEIGSRFADGYVFGCIDTYCKCFSGFCFAKFLINRREQ